MYLPTLVEGRILQGILLIVLGVAIYLYVRQRRTGTKTTLRPIPALDAIDEGVARSAEMGRTVHFTPGYAEGGLTNPDMGPGVLAGVTILKKVADSTAKRGTGVIVTLQQAETIPIVDEMLRVAYAAEAQKVPPDAVRFISTQEYSYAAGVLGILMEERPGVNIMMGYFQSESLQMAEGGNYVGAMTIGGTNAAPQIPFLLASCDYCLIGEELFAAKAYIDQDPPHLGSLVAQDLIRAILMGMILIGWIAATLAGPQVLNLMGI